MTRKTLALLACLSSVPAFALDGNTGLGRGGIGAECGAASAVDKDGNYVSRASRPATIPAWTRGPSEREVREKRLADAERVKQNARTGKILSGICSGC